MTERGKPILASLYVASINRNVDKDLPSSTEEIIEAVDDISSRLRSEEPAPSNYTNEERTSSSIASPSCNPIISEKVDNIRIVAPPQTGFMTYRGERNVRPQTAPYRSNVYEASFLKDNDIYDRDLNSAFRASLQKSRHHTDNIEIQQISKNLTNDCLDNAQQREGLASIGVGVFRVPPDETTENDNDYGNESYDRPVGNSTRTGYGIPNSEDKTSPIEAILLSSLGAPVEGIVVESPDHNTDHFAVERNGTFVKLLDTLNKRQIFIFACFISMAVSAITVSFVVPRAYPTTHPPSVPTFFKNVTAAISSIANISLPAQEASFQFILNHDPMSLSATSPNLFQRFVLMLLYYSMDGENWTNNTGFGSGENECMWYGVACDEDGLINEIIFNENSVKGTIPSEIGVLKSLVALDLYRNRVVGPLPAELGNLVNIEKLDLGSNFFTGQFPFIIKRLTNIKELNLDGCGINGTLPPNVWSGFSQIQFIDLSNNQFSGLLPKNEGLETVWSYRMNNNHFTGTISTTIGTLAEMDVLSLASNRLTGTIPTELAKLKYIRDLRLELNDLTGTSPKGLCDISRIAYWINCEVQCDCCVYCCQNQYIVPVCKK